MGFATRRNLRGFQALLIAFLPYLWPDAIGADTGLPYYTEYPAGRHLVNGSLSDMTFDRDGHLLVLSQNELFRFDGRAWTPLIPDPSIQAHPLKSIRLGPDDTLLATAIDGFGQLERVTHRQFRFVSGKPSGNKANGAMAWNFDRIFSEADGRVGYFGRDGIMLQPKSGELQWWSQPEHCVDTFRLGSNRYFVTLGAGIVTLGETPNTFDIAVSPEDGADPFTSSATAEGFIWLMTASGKLFTFDGSRLARAYTEIDTEAAASVNDIAALPGNRLAVAADGRGIFVIDQEGKLQTALRRSHDRVFAEVRQLLRGPGGMLWARADHSLVKIRVDTPLSVFDSRFDLRLDSAETFRFRNRLYIQSGTRLYGARYTASRFLFGFEELHPYGLSDVTAYRPLDDGALVSNGRTLYRGHADGSISTIARNLTVSDIIAPPQDPNEAVVICSDSIALFRRDGKAWTEVGPRFLTKGFVGNPVFADDGAVWLEGGISHIYRVDTKAEELVVTTFRFDGVLPNEWVNLWKLDGVVHASAGMQILAWKQDAGFRSTPRVSKLFESFDGWIQRPVQAPDGNIYVPHRSGTAILRPDGRGGYTRDDLTLALLDATNTVVHLDGDLVWLRNRRSLTVFDTNLPTRPYALPAPSLVEFSQQSGNNSRKVYPVGNGPLAIDYSPSNLVAEFSVNDFHLREHVRFQVRVPEQSDQWSVPFWDPLRELRGLDGGLYTVEYRAVDHLGRHSAVGSLPVRIVPPFYRAPLALVLYVLLVGAALAYLAHRYLNTQNSKRAQLAELVMKRTAELDAALRAAQAASEAKSEFLANMSHELRTPMNAVIGIAQLMAHTELSETQKNYLKILESSSASLLRLIDDILDLSRIQAARIELEEREMSIVECVESSLQMIRHQAEKKGIELSYWMEEEACRPRQGDPHRLQQILINLLNNAVKFTLNGEVRLEAWVENGADDSAILCLSVRDTGIGIPAAKQQDIFKAFTQVDSSNTRRFGGSGLGLAISQDLARLMDGRIDLQSVENEGSTFTVRIPQRPTPGHAPHGIYALRDRFAGKRVAIANLHPSTRSSLCRAFAVFGIEEVALDGPVPPDAVILDTSLKQAVSIPDALPQIRVQRLDVTMNHVEARDSIQHVNKPVLTLELERALQTVFQLAAPKEDPGEAPRDDRPRQRIRVLLAEDQPTNQSVISKMIGHLGYEVDIAEDGDEATKAALTGSYGIILMDLQMPRTNGYDATHAIRAAEIAPQPYIIAQTAAAFANDRERAFQAGVDHIITKPIRLSELADALAAGRAHTQVTRSKSDWEI